MSPKTSALDLMMRARDEWANGDVEHAVDLLDAAHAALTFAGHSEETMPTTFGLMKRIRDALVELPE